MAFIILGQNTQKGSFGKVAKCLNLTTCNTEAKNNIVRFMESFRVKNLSCLSFEMLDRSLSDLMSERRLMPLSLNEIRPVIHQLLVAFDALKDIGMLHTDLKPDNIMLVNHKDQPYKVKLIDFGLARPVTVDMWGVGCVTAFLYFGMHLFPGNCEYHCMKTMVQLLGQPEDHLLSAGIHSLLKSPEEYRKDAGVIPKERDALAYEDLMAFSSLLKSFLHLDPTKRIIPKQALKHPFF
uniref:Protein kinase domain-containing protein n=1 Tax=Sparus aurata TaxID=8175 RepID=A0A671WWE8_SPAAU